VTTPAPAYRVIDAHCHFGPFGTRTVAEKTISPLRGRDLCSIEQLSDYISSHNIDFLVLVPIYAPDPEYAFGLNTQVIACARALPGKVIPGLWVDPSPSMRNHLRDAVAMAEHAHIRVLKTSPDAWGGTFTPDPDTWDVEVRKGMDAIVAYSETRPCVLQIHTGSRRSDIRAVEKFMRWAPRSIMFQLVHMGNTTGGHFYLVPRLLEWLQEGLQVFCDTSLARGFAVRWLLAGARDNALLAERVLFASDEPWGIFDAELCAVVEATEELPAVRERVLYGNAHRLYSELRALS